LFDGPVQVLRVALWRIRRHERLFAQNAPDGIPYTPSRCKAKHGAFTYKLGFFPRRNHGSQCFFKPVCVVLILFDVEREVEDLFFLKTGTSKSFDEWGEHVGDSPLVSRA